MQMGSIVRAHYPGAKTGNEVTGTYLALIEKEYGANLSRMLFATSVCSDDVNVSTDFRRVLNRPFTMGGLGGLPYAGITGMVAFSHHIPDGGDAFIFYGPHIGMTDEGEPGRMRRIGQRKLTNSCGALMLALARFSASEAGQVYVPVGSEYDYQQTLLERTLMPFKHEILSAKNPKKEITDRAFAMIDKTIKDLVKLTAKEFSCDRIFLLGGVIINTSEEYNDYVDVRNFDVLHLKEIHSEPANFQSIMASPAYKEL